MIEALVHKIAAENALTKRGDRYVGPCPECGGSSKTDKFNMRLDGGFKCYACDFKGDIISWLRGRGGLSCPEAHETAGQPCRAGSNCAAWGTCRMGDGSGKKQIPRHRPSVTPIKAPAARTLPVSTATNPADLWRQWAETTIIQAENNLCEQKAAITWLNSRGIDGAAITRFHLGWLAKNLHVNRQSIGLSADRDGKKDLWVPAGLVVPTFINRIDPQLHRLRIRRPGWAREKFLPELKYLWIEGSGNAPMAIRPTLPCRGVVVVEAELDAMTVAAAHRSVLVLAIGTVKGPLPEGLLQELAELPVILVALDADDGKNKKPGAGQQAVATWLKQFRHAKYWPVPAGKDPGEYVKEHQGDVAAWVESGLIPERPASASSMQFSGGSVGGGGVVSPQPTENNAPQVKHFIITLPGGVEAHVVDSEAAWWQLVNDGEKFVFSENELDRLRKLCTGMTADEMARAVQLTLAIKEEFSGAYLRQVRKDQQQKEHK
jgi:DNA primase